MLAFEELNGEQRRREMKPANSREPRTKLEPTRVGWNVNHGAWCWSTSPFWFWNGFLPMIRALLLLQVPRAESIQLELRVRQRRHQGNAAERIAKERRNDVPQETVQKRDLRSGHQVEDLDAARDDM